MKSRKQFQEHIFRNTGTLERCTKIRDSEITDGARASFYRAFGITPDYQLALEEYFDAFVIESLNAEYVRDGLVENQPPVFLRHL
jgi:hypothetical protein